MKLRVLALVLVAAACGNKSSSTKQAPASAKPIVQPKDIPDGLDLKLSDGKQGAPAYDKSKLAAAKKLGDADVAQILQRADPLKTDPDDQQAFALRPMSQPPPRTGNTIKDTFPANPSSLLPPAPTQQGKDLQVLRYMPEGDVPLAPELTVTFNQPMVAVTSQDDAAKTKPVKLTPEPKGHWRWIGTRTILFDPDVRFPQATTYKVSIPAGTKSATGETLKKDVAFSFETPTAKLISHYPDEYQPQHTDVPMFVMFDQKIDPQAVLAKIKVQAPGAPPQQQGSASNDPWKGTAATQMHTVAIKALDDKEIAASHAIKSLVDAANKEPDRRWIAFRTVDKLPQDASITVEIPAGTPSAEGPNLTKDAQTFTFHTYPPFLFVDGQCSYNNQPCPPGAAMTMYFNNPVDQDKFDEKLVTVTPEVPGMKVVAGGNAVSIIGMAKARTEYKVTIGSGLVDEFEQKLAKPATHTFNYGDASPTFFGPSGMVVLDPAGAKPTLDFFSTNYDSLKVRIYKVGPDDLKGFYRYQSEQWNKDHPPPIPGSKVFDGLVKTKDAKNELVETSVDLAPALTKSGYGHAIVIVEPSPWTQKWDPPRMIAWVQSTKLAVDAHVDNENLLAFATDLATGKPVDGVQLEIRPTGTRGTTDAQGLATLPLGGNSRQTNVLVARKGEDVALLPENDGYWGDYGSWYKQGRSKQLAWYVIDDRKLYKPGEEVSLKGWLRQIDYGKQGDVLGIEGGVSKISYKVRDSVGNEIAKGSMPVNPVGGFDTKFTLPKTPNLGYANVELSTEGRLSSYYNHNFQIEEFRRPEFEVSASASVGPFMIGGGGDITVAAKYFAGGVLPGAQVDWYVTATPTSFTPPNRDDYVFGQWTPWWGYHAWYDDDGNNQYKPQPSWQHAAKTDAMGEHVLHMDFLSAKPSVPMSVSANASVQDVNRQTWTASQSIIVHPAAYYVGVKTKRPFVEKGTPFDLDVIVTDIEGVAVPGAKVDVKSVRLDWEYKKGKYQSKEVDEQHCVVVSKKDTRAPEMPCEFKTTNGGSYQLTALVTDDKGRQNQTKMTYWVSGGENPPSRDVAMEAVQMIPDKKEYTPGNTAEILVQAPFYPAEGIVTWRRSGIVKTERITLTGPTASLKVPITDDLVPNLYVQVDLVGLATRTDDTGVPDPKLPKRPAYAVGNINLPVPPKQRTLAVTATPAAAKLAPSEETTIALEVKDANGKPVEGAEAAIIVVDESVLTLAGYSAPNPIDSFYPQRGADTRDYYERAYVKLVRPDLAQQGAMNGQPGTGRYGTIGHGSGTGAGYGVGGGKGGGGSYDKFAADMPAPAAAAPMEEMEMKKSEAAPAKAKVVAQASRNRADAIADARSAGLLGASGDTAGFAPPPPIAVRTNFNALAAFSPSVKTDANGKASIPVKMPDNLTRYRVIAVAAAGDKQFGKGESAITARLPLMVRPSPPRFLNFGDVFQLPVVVQNQTDSPMTVRLAARVGNARLTDGAGREVMVPANDRMEVQFPAAADMAGTARFQIVGVAGNATDAANIELPVWTPTTTEAFATYGVIDDGAIAQPVQLPGKVWPQFGGLEVTTASTNLQALTDAVIYLVHYPFDCAEQRSARIMALASLRDVLAAFKSKDLPTAAAMEHSVDVDLEHLTQMQNYDGGFVYWERGYPSEPYLSVFVMQALFKAKTHGYSVPANMYERGRYFLRDIERYYPYWYDKETRDAISAYALYVRKQIGDLDIAKTKALYASANAPEKVAMEVNGWLLSTLAGNASAQTERAAIVRYAMNHVSETAGAANFTTSYGDGKYVLLASDRRTDGVMLEALIQEQKNNDLIPKIVTGLLAHRKRGHWLNTQENAFVLTALELYFKTYEKVTPNFVARLWLGNDYAGDHAFKGRTTEYYQVGIAMKDVAAHDKQNLTIQKDGAGRLYYRIGMTYAPEDLKVPAADYGFVVERKYEGVDNPADVTRDAQGTWHFKAGARIRVKLSMVNENRRYMVALVDPMPAGVEAMNPALATTGPIPQSPAAPDDQNNSRGRYWWWYGPWYEHQNMRDERVEAFASLLWEGVHKYEYVARATTPGNFVVPPPKAEEMYMPETFGRGDSDRVIVE